MYQYKKTFMLKDEKQREKMDFFEYTNAIRLAERQYNERFANAKNAKHITIVVLKNRLDINVLSKNPLQLRYVGNALQFFSHILVEQFGFLKYCVNKESRRLFISDD